MRLGHQVNSEAGDFSFAISATPVSKDGSFGFQALGPATPNSSLDLLGFVCIGTKTAGYASSPNVLSSKTCRSMSNTGVQVA